MGTDQAPIEKPGTRTFNDYLLSAVLRGSAELRTLLPMDETLFLRVAASAHSDARAYYLYAVADELARVGSAMIRWKELIPDDPPTPTQEGVTRDLQADAIERTTLGAMLTEQSLWVRRLLECLVDLICFEKTNDNAYYKHYLLIDELERRLHFESDQRDFLGKRSANIAFGTDSIVRQIREIEGKLNLDLCWYRNKAVALPAAPKKRLQSSFRNRLKRALVDAHNTERLLLGLTYRMYSKASEDIHFTPHETHRATEPSKLSVGVLYCGMLAIRILIRTHELIGFVPSDGQSAQLHRVFGEGAPGLNVLRVFTEPVASKGDFVTALGGLAEVREAERSSFGYYMYHVEYLADAPIPEIKEEWLPPDCVALLFSRDKLIARIHDVLQESGVDASTLSADELSAHLRDAAIAAWRAGLSRVVQQ